MGRLSLSSIFARKDFLFTAGPIPSVGTAKFQSHSMLSTNSERLVIDGDSVNHESIAGPIPGNVFIVEGSRQVLEMRRSAKIG